MAITPEQREAQRQANFGIRPGPVMTPEARAARSRKLQAQGRGIASPALRGKK